MLEHNFQSTLELVTEHSVHLAAQRQETVVDAELCTVELEVRPLSGEVSHLLSGTRALQPSMPVGAGLHFKIVSHLCMEDNASNPLRLPVRQAAALASAVADRGRSRAARAAIIDSDLVLVE